MLKVIYYLSTVTVVCFVLLCARILYLILRKPMKGKNRLQPVKTLIVLGSGGHTAEMLRILNHLNLNNYSPRIYAHARTDRMSVMKAKQLEGNNTDYKIIEIYRSREVHQSYLTSIWSTLLAILDSIPVIWNEKPELLLCNGPGTCVPLCVIAEHSQTWIENSLVIVEACLDRTWESLNSGYWKDVSMKHRYSYTLCSIIKTVLLELQYQTSHKESKQKEMKILKDAIQQLDKGILLGAPLPDAPNLLTIMASKINNYFNMQSEKPIQKKDSKEIVWNEKEICDTIIPGFLPIKCYKEPSMECFYRDIFVPKVPSLLKGCIGHWKALKLWHNTEYLNKVAGNRTVPIEIGSRYTEEDWSQQLTTFSDFLETYVTAQNAKVGYLAQHQLFEQIPELKDDFAVPEYCSFSDKEESDEPPDTNAWFGPGGTVSPLHYDPKNNLLCQVFGYKRVILYSPADTENLYPYETRLLNNTAQVDPMNPDYEKWPNFQKVKGIMCHLKPGEMLYIPPKWWHHVTALTPSFSISFWWD